VLSIAGLAETPEATIPPEQRGRLALIGDLHSAWDDTDTGYFNETAYELLLFAGDLGGTGRRDGMQIARSIAKLTRPALLMPGNNDVDHYAALSAELTYRRVQADLLRDLAVSASPGAERTIEPGVRTCGFSSHPVIVGDLEVTIIAGRPFAAGGGQFSSAETLALNFGIGSMEESSARLRSLVDQAPTEHLIFFSHNGPIGLGAEPDALWGRDFGPEPGDWGDPDLRDAIAHAGRRRRRILAVVAGHMHWHLRTGGKRRVEEERDGILYVNCAQVPRIIDSREGTARHHIALGVRHGLAQIERITVVR
jgi:uncharacterized protein (TIGR04168 family)